ncbi:MAG: DUF169 domain-containing protein [Planctomycetota bacterium]
MDIVPELQKRIGGRWTGVRFLAETPTEALADRTMRFCEAVSESYIRPIVLTPGLVDCPGARRAFGWTTEADDELAATMAEKMGTGSDSALRAIRETPHLADPAGAVRVGGPGTPDVVLTYAQPEAVMRVLHRWQANRGETPQIRVSSVMAVCGNVAVRAYLTDEICVSFGCPDSRTEGAVGRDRVILGMSAELAETLLGSPPAPGSV